MIQTVYLVRHGETDYNLQGRWQGHLDVDLNAEGRQQARLLGEYLVDTQFDAVYCSDLRRARDTAELVLGERKSSIVFDVRLREGLLGVFQGLTRMQIVERYPYELTHWDTDPHYVVPDGESRMQMMERAFAAWSDITGRHLGQRVLIVSHGGTLRQMLRRVLQPDSTVHLRFANTSVTVLERVDQGSWTIRCLNSIAHLQEAPTDSAAL